VDDRPVPGGAGLCHDGTFKEESLHLTRGWVDGVTYAMLASEYVVLR